MLRKITCAIAILGLSLGLSTADEIKGKITRVSDGKVTIAVKNKDTKKADAKDLLLAKDCKVSKKEGKSKAALADGLKAAELSSIDAKKGLKGTVLTNADNQVTEIIINAKKKKKKDNN